MAKINFECSTIYFLADASIAENIAFGIKKDLISMRRIKEAAKKAQLHEFIESTNLGYDSIIERGVSN